MKFTVLLGLLALGSVGVLTAQTAPKPTKTPGTQAAPTAQTVPAPAPLPDEKSLSITDTPGAPAGGAGPSTDIGPWEFVKMFVILALVIGMILGFVWFMRKLSGRQESADSAIRVLHTKALGGNRTLQVVEVGTEVFLIGVADGGVSLVKELTGSEAADGFRLAASQGKTGAKTGFSDLLAGLMGVKPKIRPDVAAPGENSSDFLKKQRERLKKL